MYYDWLTVAFIWSYSTAAASLPSAVASISYSRFCKIQLYTHNYVDDPFYMKLFSTIQQTHCTFVACDSEWVTVAFCSVFWISTEVVYVQHCLVLTWLVQCKTAAISARFVYTLQTCTMSHTGTCTHTHTHAHSNAQEFVLAPTLSHRNKDIHDITECLKTEARSRMRERVRDGEKKKVEKRRKEWRS